MWDGVFFFSRKGKAADKQYLSPQIQSRAAYGTPPNNEQSYRFNSPIGHFKRGEKSIPFCVENADFPANTYLEMTGC